MFKFAVFSLNQWALDFVGNRKRIISSIEEAYNAGCSFRAGPELELCGYSVEDGFFGNDVVDHCWDSLLEIIVGTKGWNILIDIGMPIRNNSLLYNCRILIYKGRILFIRAKTSLAREEIYREDRHFGCWKKGTGLEPYTLPCDVANKLKQTHVPFGDDFALKISSDGLESPMIIGWEICQELWDIRPYSSELYNDFGCHLIVNGSGSYWQLRKLSTVLDYIKDVSFRSGACYAFSNLVGCDGQRYVFYGRSCIYDKGTLADMTPVKAPSIFTDIQMCSYTIDTKSIDEFRQQVCFRSNRNGRSLKEWDLLNPPSNVELINREYNLFHLDMKLTEEQLVNLPKKAITTNAEMRFEMEIHTYVGLWLWDYLRKSGMKGFMMPLSGGLDSSTVAVLVYGMCQQILLSKEDTATIEYFKNVHQLDMRSVINSKTLCGHLLKCCYLSTQYSSSATEKRAVDLSRCIGANFESISIQPVYETWKKVFKKQTTTSDKNVVTLLDQNLQARIRKNATYQLSEGNRLVLATGNVDEAIVGYLTKYDCSSADINPIGGLCKNDLKSYLRYCCSDLYSDQPELVETLKSIIDAPPSAELTGADQRDEDEIGLTYDEISVLGRIRRGIYGCNGPKGAFETLWNYRHNEPFKTHIRCLRNLACHSIDESGCARLLAELVKRFYNRYSRNRHKLTVLTPSLHAETYSPDDNRFDHRQILFPPWDADFGCIDRMVDAIISKQKSISTLFKVAIFVLNQSALNLVDNQKRIISSIEAAYEANCSYRAGPELELCGYSAADNFFGNDVVDNCWVSLMKIIDATKKWNILIDIGMPVRNNSLVYNCRILLYKRRILFIGAKTSIAKEGVNHLEDEHFSYWKKGTGLTSYRLPSNVADELRQTSVPFGDDFVLEISSNSLKYPIIMGWDLSEEFCDIIPNSLDLYQNFGCHLIVNGSTSCSQLKKSSAWLDLIKSSTVRGGACYAFSTLIGLDAQSHGTSCIYDKGRKVDITPDESSSNLSNIRMSTHIIDTKSIDEYRAQMAIRPDRNAKPRKVWDLSNPSGNVESIDKTFNVFHLNLD